MRQNLTVIAAGDMGSSYSLKEDLEYADSFITTIVKFFKQF